MIAINGVVRAVFQNRCRSTPLVDGALGQRLKQTLFPTRPHLLTEEDDFLVTVSSPAIKVLDDSFAYFWG
jgi:hypothetical protein